MHLFLGGCDRFVVEYDKENRLICGFAIINGDYQNAEWSYSSLDELIFVKVCGGIEIDRDLHWTPRSTQNKSRKGDIHFALVAI